MPEELDSAVLDDPQAPADGALEAPSEGGRPAPDDSGTPGTGEEGGDKTPKRVEDTLKEAQRRLHAIAEKEKRLDAVLARHDAESKKPPPPEPEPDPLESLDDGFFKEVGTLMIDEPEKAARKLMGVLKSARETDRRTIAALHDQITNAQSRASVKDQRITAALDILDAGEYGRVLRPEEKMEIAQKMVETMGQSKAQYPDGRAPSASPGASRRAEPAQPSRKPSVPEGYYAASGASQGERKPGQIWDL